MKQTMQRRICLVLLTFLLSHASEQEVSNSSSCSATPERLSAQLKESLNCIDVLASKWAENETASVLDSLKTAIKVLRKDLQECPTKYCPVPESPANGGLVCATIGETRYCKPMCNEGFDFAFLRLSRLYEECQEKTKSKWTTQYIGGNKLAVCLKTTSQVAGAKSAYFPKDQDCLKTKSQSKLESQVIETFVSELEGKGLIGTAESKCLTCG